MTALRTSAHHHQLKGLGTAQHRGSVAASHPAAPGSILDNLKNCSLGVAKID